MIKKCEKYGIKVEKIEFSEQVKKEDYSEILSMIQAGGNTFLGFHVFGQQVLSAISLILLIAAMVVNKTVIQKQSVIKQ